MPGIQRTAIAPFITAFWLVVSSMPVLAGDKLKVSSRAQFCDNIKDAAQEKRYAIKTRELDQLKAAVEERINRLEEKRKQFESWQKKRDQFIALADKTLIEIYSKMRPDAAASRLEMLADTLAASIVMKLSARKAGAILNEMKAEKAAVITQIIASSGAEEGRS